MSGSHLQVIEDIDGGPPTRHRWKEVKRSPNGYSITYALDGSRSRLYLLTGRGDHGDHVNTMLWKFE